MKHLMITLALLAIGLGAAAQPMTNYKHSVDTGIIDKTLAHSISRATHGGLMKALADSVAGRTDTVNKVASRYWTDQNYLKKSNAYVKDSLYTRRQSDSALSASLDSINSAQLAVNALQQYWLEKRVQDTTYTVPDSIVILINGTRRAYRISITGGASYSAGAGIGFSGSVIYLDSAVASTVKRLQDSTAALRAYVGTLNAGYQDSMLVNPNGSRTATLKYDGSFSLPVGVIYGKSTVTKINLFNNGSGFQVWSGSSGLSLLQSSTSGFSWSVGSFANGDVAFGFYPQVFAFTPSGQGILGGTSTWNTASLCVGDGSLADRTSLMDLNIHDSVRGFRPPRMTAAQRSAIVGPAPWLHAFQKDGNRGNYYYDSTTAAWVKILDAKDTVGLHGGGGGVTDVDGLTGSVGLASRYIQASPSSVQTQNIHVGATSLGMAPIWAESAYTGYSQFWTSTGGANTVALSAYTNFGCTGVSAGDAVLWAANPMNVGQLNAAGLRFNGTSSYFSGCNVGIGGATAPNSTLTVGNGNGYGAGVIEMYQSGSNPVRLRFGNSNNAYDMVLLASGNTTGWFPGGYTVGATAALTASAGQVGINVVSVPNASAALEVASTTTGFLPPRMTSAQRLLISSPAVGLQVYQTDGTEGLYQYKSTGWDFIH